MPDTANRNETPTRTLWVVGVTVALDVVLFVLAARSVNCNSTDTRPWSGADKALAAAWLVVPPVCVIAASLRDAAQRRSAVPIWVGVAGLLVVAGLDFAVIGEAVSQGMKCL